MKMRNFTVTALIFAIAAMLLLAGCGNKAEEAKSDVKETSESGAKAEQPAASAPVESKPAEATSEAPAAQAAPAEPVQSAELDIDESELDLGENPDTGVSEELDVPTLQ